MPDVRDLLSNPVVVAPMAGGPSTPELVAAAAGAGALAFVAGGYRTAEQLRADVEAVRARTAAPFGVNVFVPGRPAPHRDAVDAYADRLRNEGYDVAPAEWDDDHWSPKIDLLVDLAPAVVTFTFGAPAPDVVARLGERGCIVGVTVTTPEDAVTAAAAGAGFLCVQGPEAGAHRGTFSVAAQPDDRPLPRLMRDVAAATDLPFLAGGGVATAEDVSGVLGPGAAGVLCGTAFLRCPESGARAEYKAALADPRFTETVVTRAFSGRPARGLRNRFVTDHPDAPPGYPEINNATRPLRAAGGADTMSLWAGTGWRRGQAGPVVAVLDALRPRR